MAESSLPSGGLFFSVISYVNRTSVSAVDAADDVEARSRSISLFPFRL